MQKKKLKKEQIAIECPLLEPDLFDAALTE